MESSPPPRQHPGPDRPARRAIASYARYGDAERTVDHLADAGFAVERTAIAAQGLRFVEEVTGRRTAARAAAEGAGQGGVVGGAIGLFLGLFGTNTGGLVLLGYGIVIGLILGALVGLLLHAAGRSRRDFSSAGRMEADHYDVLVDEPVAEEAHRLLDEPAPHERSG